MRTEKVVVESLVGHHTVIIRSGREADHPAGSDHQVEGLPGVELDRRIQRHRIPPPAGRQGEIQESFRQGVSIDILVDPDVYRIGNRPFGTHIKAQFLQLKTLASEVEFVGPVKIEPIVAADKIIGVLIAVIQRQNIGRGDAQNRGPAIIRRSVPEGLCGCLGRCACTVGQHAAAAGNGDDSVSVEHRPGSAAVIIEPADADVII